MGSDIKGFYVVLKEDVHATYAEKLGLAISMLNGVGKVVPIESNPVEDFVTRTRIKSMLYDKLNKVVDEL